MKITIEQIFGSQEQIDLHLQKLILNLQDSPENEALEKGWTIFNNKWYLSRSTRIKVDNYKLPKPIEGYTFEYTENHKVTEEIEKVNRDFLAYKGFEPLYDLNTDLNRTSWMLVKRKGILCAFTKFNMYEGGLESNLSSWDYSEPEKRIGSKLVDYEVDIARSKGYKYLYIGPGCGKSAKYKASFKGFQWWDGENWTDDRKKYLELCDRDANIETLKQLSGLFNATS